MNARAHSTTVETAAHAQAVYTRPYLFPSTQPGYEAITTHAKTDTKKVCTTQNSMNQLSVLHRSKKMRDDLLSDGMHQLTAHFMYIHPGLCL